MEFSDLSPEADGYYKDNLLSLCEALVLLGDAPNTGDWFWELIDYLKERADADAERANVKPRSLALMIYRAANKTNVLDLLAMIDEEPQ